MKSLRIAVLSPEQKKFLEDAILQLDLIEVVALRIAAEDVFDAAHLYIYDLLKSLHNTRSALKELPHLDLPQTSQ